MECSILSANKFDCPAAALPENVNNHPGQFGHNI